MAECLCWAIGDTTGGWQEAWAEGMGRCVCAQVCAQDKARLLGLALQACVFCSPAPSTRSTDIY